LFAIYTGHRGSADTAGTRYQAGGIACDRALAAFPGHCREMGPDCAANTATSAIVTANMSSTTNCGRRIIDGHLADGHADADSRLAADRQLPKDGTPRRERRPGLGSRSGPLGRSPAVSLAKIRNIIASRGVVSSSSDSIWPSRRFRLAGMSISS
jgi:hypothetical protein